MKGVKTDLNGAAWWAKRRRTYNILLIFAGIAAFAGMAMVGETACAADPDFEITVFTIAFQAIGYAVALAIANLLYGLGLAVERLFKPRNLSLYRGVAFGAGAAFSVVVPLSVPLMLFVQCTIFTAQISN